MPDVLLASPYPDSVASTRERLGPLRRNLEARGITVEQRSFIDEAGLRDWLAGGHRRLPPALRAVGHLRDAALLARRARVTVVQREAALINSLVVERQSMAGGGKLVWDIDDSLWTSGHGALTLLRGTPDKYAWLARHSREVWAGSCALQGWVTGQGNAHVHHVPATVDVPKTPGGAVQRRQDLLVWIGTPSTGRFLEHLLSRIHSALSEWEILIVGARIAIPPDVRATQVDWSPETQRAALNSGTVGLYPIDDAHPLAAGKSAHKSVMYMANGLPFIATPTQATIDVAEGSDCCIFAREPDEWVAALSTLQSMGRREAMGMEGFRRAQASYSAEHWGRWTADRIEHLLDRP